MTEQQADTKQGVYIRKIRSFVKREGRLTQGQARAIDNNWAAMGLTMEQGMLNLTEVFGRSAPVVLEIGFGMGKSLVQMAAAERDKDFIGIEVHRPGVGACLMDAEAAELTNLRVLEADAVEVLEQCIPDGSLARLQLYFPDPWHKKRHHKRRIVQPDFAKLVRHKLQVGGVWHMATDWENYAQHMLEVMSEAPGFINRSESGDYVPRPDFRPETKFEQRGQRLGHGVWDLMFEREA
ncbi:tRNA (guanosine(46)-N7)-methyltransferase TrmB [Lacimicrobium alkaliphilum]|uniref:tRNA (guanine-N(7)-)-methyltransferase n=1 Tax=Lacimicrobium alkaliphilum TaxID=1526571 RepID=A0ABQ1RAL5_9ALTE|nr:tRNA (guanine-N(7)-)-methyltransferase [Lacimicrobium alkaliphilum]